MNMLLINKQQKDVILAISCFSSLAKFPTALCNFFCFKQKRKVLANFGPSIFRFVVLGAKGSIKFGEY